MRTLSAYLIGTWIFFTRFGSFLGADDWIESDALGRVEGLPHVYEPGYFIEAIDGSESDLVYEGFHNIRHLIFLKYLDLSYCR